MSVKKVFDPNTQQNDLSSKIVVGLERISQAFKVLLWQQAKELGLSPIQIQILIFIAHHNGPLNNVSALAQEFNVTKPTISDAIKVLERKSLVIKDHSSPDSRSYTLLLSNLGQDVVKNTENFTSYLVTQIDKLNEEDQKGLYRILGNLIYQLNKNGILSVQRTCYACKFYQKTTSNHYCHLLEQQLKDADIRLDCVEFEANV
ncbi:MarR family transcriptional regulator [Muricauda sp. 2012CJ35-5]|uniref:MarR family transcriptional regulator n=1 Tax=Flagellimonas spongiicola TaxID=2942208 RepID=A0ABT0PUI3_9FLAO|nr:MarR family winged helix-turn-helix transcriptional regulator [Allomuricauda spongiicola]MCL6275043.1 MarR family transcriptional regulator [Allomuricauda spongiicola]